jgi:hypothetical protein
MTRYECTVVVTEKCIVEFDETVCNKKWLKGFNHENGEVLTLSQHAKNIAESRAKNGVTFIENYGVPLSNGVKPWFIEQKDLNDAINVTACEDNDIVVEVREIHEGN